MPTSQQQATASYYDDYSSWYENERREGYYSIINDLEVDALRPFAEGNTTLELGFGTGLILERVASIADDAFGLDLSSGMARFSSEKGLSVVNATATEIPFKDDSVDLVYSCKVLAHVPDIAGALQEVARVLRPEGHALLEFYNKRSFKALTYRIQTIRRRGVEPVFVRHDSLADVESYLPEGWEIRSVRGMRTFGPIKQAYTTPIIGGLLHHLERRFCDSWIGRQFGGYMLVGMGPTPSGPQLPL